MHIGLTLQRAYRALQIGLLASFLSMLFLLYTRGAEQADHERRMRLIDKLTSDLAVQQERTNQLMAEARRTLAAAQAWNPGQSAEPPAVGPQRPAPP